MEVCPNTAEDVSYTYNPVTRLAVPECMGMPLGFDGVPITYKEYMTQGDADKALQNHLRRFHGKEV